MITYNSYLRGKIGLHRSCVHCKYFCHNNFEKYICENPVFVDGVAEIIYVHSGCKHWEYEECSDSWILEKQRLRNVLRGV